MNLLISKYQQWTIQIVRYYRMTLSQTVTFSLTAMIAPIRRSAAFRGVRSLVHEAARTLDLTSRADMAGVDLDVEYTKLHFADQTVHAGTHAMPVRSLSLGRFEQYDLTLEFCRNLGKGIPRRTGGDEAFEAPYCYRS
eukprot:1130716-Amorphochlora_amoeboformis.AAC.1